MKIKEYPTLSEFINDLKRGFDFREPSSVKTLAELLNIATSQTYMPIKVKFESKWERWSNGFHWVYEWEIEPIDKKLPIIKFNLGKYYAKGNEYKLTIGYID